MMTKNKKVLSIPALAVFDLDGTLMDAYPSIAESFNYAMTKMGYPAVDPELIRRKVGWGDRHLMRTFVHPDDLDRTMFIFRKHHPQALKKGVKLMPGALRLLKRLKKHGVKLAVASNRSTKTSLIAMRSLGIRKYFDCVMCADKLNNPKPHPEVLVKILKKFRLKSTQAVFVGDMTIDIETGNKAGVSTIAVITGSSTQSAIRKMKPRYIAANLDAVARMIVLKN